MPTFIVTFAPRNAHSRAVFTKLAWKRSDNAFEPLSCADCAKVEAPWRISTVGQSSAGGGGARSEEHTSELQSRLHLVCRLLLEKKKKNEFSHLLVQKKNTKNQTT